MNIYEYMANIDIVGQSVDVDALTVTATGLGGKITIDMLLHSIEKFTSVEEAKPFKFLGAKGWSRGSVSYADKWNSKQQREWAILMVKGKAASTAWNTVRQFDRYDVKVTRLDICVDIELRSSVLGLCRKLKDGHKGVDKPRLIEGLTGDTLYYGSRESDKFVRVYDKSPDYNQSLGSVYRFELEAKGELAGNLAEWLEDGDLGEKGEELVWAALKEFNAPTPRQGTFPNILHKRVTLSSAEMKINWLERQVKPTVKWLKALGLEGEVKEALGLAEQLQMSLNDDGKTIDISPEVV